MSSNSQTKCTLLQKVTSSIKFSRSLKLDRTIVRGWLSSYRHKNAESVEPMVITDKIEATLLVIEKDSATRRGMKRLLEMDGYRVRAVANEQEAVLAARRKSYDLILFDTDLPPPESFNAAYQIHQNSELQDIPIIAISVHKHFGVSPDSPAVDKFTVAYLANVYRFDELEKLADCLLKMKMGL